jgi:anti-sigma factor RsiW
MNCTEAIRSLDAYVDGEADAKHARELEAHLGGCAGCSARHREALAWRARLRHELTYFKAPTELAARVRTTLGESRWQDAGRAGAGRSREAWFSWGALAGCAATLILSFSFTSWQQAQRGSELTERLVAAHADASREGRLIMVASSDRHTVKPWLSARLDYSPPVHDLADQGFALQGARIVPMQGKDVAVLVYKVREHVIDVFVQPEGDSPPVAPRTVRGFHVESSQAARMQWIAVSDVREDELAQFLARLTAAATQP